MQNTLTSITTLSITFPKHKNKMVIRKDNIYFRILHSTFCQYSIEKEIR